MKPRVIVLGGCGFIGRSVVELLVTEEIAGEVRAVDKVPPQTAWLNPSQKLSFNNVTFVSANLINTDSCKSAFWRSDGKWDWVINCAGETRLGLSDVVYEEGIVALSRNAAQLAAAHDAAYLEISCCMVSNKKIACKESDERRPVGRLAKFKRLVEDELSAMSGLKRYIVRPGLVYGPGDRSGLMPLIIMGAIYKEIKEPMKMLWSRDLRSNTVHVTDLARAVIHILKNSNSTSAGVNIFHVVDQGCSTQGSLCQLVSEMFGIEYSFYGTAFSTFAKGDLEHVAEECNEKHLGPWASLCAVNHVDNTPLTPYLTADNFIKSHIHLDGSKLIGTGFTYLYPQPTKQTLVKVVEEYVDMELFPKASFS